MYTGFGITFCDGVDGTGLGYGDYIDITQRG